MSLKSIHLIFIVFADLFCILFAIWAPRYSAEMEEQMRVPGLVTAVLGSFLLIYGLWFAFKKSSKIIVQ